jgi:hypothetical protein
MQKLVSLCFCLSAFCFTSLRAADQPRGSLLELHSCELYAGGCVVSSEEPMDGRQMLRVWNFTGGSFAGSDFAGLQLALLQSSPDNLAAANAKSGEAVAYLPQAATPSQREALIAWLKASQKDFKPAHLQTRLVPLHFAKAGAGYAFSAGDYISVKTASLESCETGACGESLWYSPHADTTLFTVVVDRASRVNEPLLQLRWNDAGKRSIFLAKFGESAPARNIYVTATDFCSPATKLF